MKKNIILAVALSAMTTLGLVSCDKSSPKMDDKTAAAAPKSGEGTKIAYVEVDSIMTQYTFCKEYSKILETKGNNIQKTLASKQQQLQAAAANFQQKIQQNAYTREQAEAIQAGLQKQNNDLQVPERRVPDGDGKLQQGPARFAAALPGCLQQGQEVQSHLLQAG